MQTESPICSKKIDTRRILVSTLFCLPLLSWISSSTAGSTTIDIQCENNQLVVSYNLAEGDTCTGERVEIVNDEVTRFPLFFTESRDRPARALLAGQLITVNGFLECTNETTGIVSRVSSSAASQNGCGGEEEQTGELFENVSNEISSQQDLNNQQTLIQLQSANDLEAELCQADGTSDPCIAARSATQALREELGIDSAPVEEEFDTEAPSQ